jgi:two-component system, OmpR family, phosphate regulon response regulator PhoB
MNQIAILCLEDEPDVRNALIRDLHIFQQAFRVEPASDVPDALEVLHQIKEDGDRLGLVLADHRLPGKSGVDFLIELVAMPSHRDARKVLVTGQADQEDTIRAINEAGLDHYIQKPWDTAKLVAVVRDELTDFVLGHDIDPMPYLSVLDGSRLLEKVARCGWQP